MSHSYRRFSISRISVVRSALFDVGLVPCATELTAKVVYCEVSVSLDIVGPNGWVRMTRPALDLPILG